PLEGILVQREPRRLPLLAIRLEPQPRQIVADRLDEPFLAARRVGIVDPQQEAPTVLLRQQPVVQRGADVADVQPPGGRGGEADDDGHARRLAPAHWLNKMTECPPPANSMPFEGSRRTASAASKAACTACS